MLYLDNSLAGLIHECETKAWLRGVQEVAMAETRKGAREVGTVIHQTFAAHLQGQGWQPAFSQAWDDAFQDEVPQEERLHKANVEAVLRHWFSQLPWQFVVKGTELTLEAKIGTLMGEAVMWYGTLDVLVEWNGLLYVLDLKTTGRHLDETWQVGYQLSSQLQGYVWGARRNSLPVKGAFILGLEVGKLPPWDGNLDKKCQTHKLKYWECQGAHVRSVLVGPLTWTDAQLLDWQRSFVRKAARLQALTRVEDPLVLDMGGMYSYPGCGQCQFRRWCLAGRPLEAVQTMMRPEPWRRNAVEEVL